MKISKYIVALLLIALMGCNKNEDEDFMTQYEADIEKIENYLAENNLEAEKTSTGLYYIIEEEGNGAYPTSTSIVTVSYTGYLLNGSQFDSGTISQSLSGNLIEGWKEGIPKFRNRARGKLLIPSYMGYGSDAKDGIPANSVLIFDIYLVSFR